MQIEVHDIHAEVAGARLAAERVHVGTIHIKECALGVQDVGDLVDLALEDADGGWVGEHEGGGLVVDLLRELLNVDHAVHVRAQVFYLIAADGGGGGVGAVRGVGDEYAAARIAFRLVVSAGEQDAGELAMRARGGLQRDGIHAGDFDERFFECAQHPKRALRQRFGLIRDALRRCLQGARRTR